MEMKVGDQVISPLNKYVGIITKIVYTENTYIYFVTWGKNNHSMHTKKTISPLKTSELYNSIW